MKGSGFTGCGKLISKGMKCQGTTSPAAEKLGWHVL
jgi:hypothetical protein